MFKNIKLGTKIGLGFGCLIVITLLVGGMSVYTMRGAATESINLANEFVPQIDVAMDIRYQTNDIMFAMRGYEYAEHEQYYQEALSEIKHLDAAIAEGDKLKKSAVNLVKLPGILETIKTARNQYVELIELTRQGLNDIKAGRTTMNTNADEFMKFAYAYLENQKSALATEMTERDDKLRSMNILMTIGTGAHMEILETKSANNIDQIQKIVNQMDTIAPIIATLRKTVRKEENIKLLDSMDTSVSAYKDIMKSYVDGIKKNGAADDTLFVQAKGAMATFLANSKNFIAAQQASLKQNTEERNFKMIEINDMIDLGNVVRIKFNQGQAVRDVKIMVEGEKNFELIYEKIKRIRQVTSVKDMAEIDNFEKSMKSYQQTFLDFITQWKKLDEIAVKRI
ncbi:MAG: MCP four helix bundle domain-containing protein [Desulfamplus sp.]|nr:MCP four helix bundle domain-containing protein [Desulfamplus sp.]